jgi:hypothetical protein
MSTDQHEVQFQPVPESRFTPPTARCPDPGRWHSTDPQSTEVEVSALVGAFVGALQPDYVIETGTCLAQTAWFIGATLAEAGRGHLDTLEPNHELADICDQRVAGLPVTVRRARSLEFTPRTTIGFAWFDSLMSLRVAEFEAYRPYMIPGTVCGFHDTAVQGGHGEALQAEIEAIHGTRVISLPTPRGVTFLEVL